MKENIKCDVDKYILNDGSLDADKIQNDFFPTIEGIDIFLSHSHKDKELAIAFSGWLNKKFKIKTFIDSCLWGYCDDLLEEIDINKRYSKCDDSELLDYGKVKASTSHVYMMLSSALTNMMDKCECLIFFNTKNSICSVEDVIENKTKSPWIYSEICTSGIIKRKKIDKKRMDKIPKEQLFSENAQIENAELEITYKVGMDHLIKCTRENLEKWRDNSLYTVLEELYDIFSSRDESMLYKNGKDALDELYKLKLDGSYLLKI